MSLHWLAPGHTFRTSYAAQDNSPAKQHIITFDVKSSTATYVAPDHPFPAYDRTQQSAFLLSFPKWDEDQSSNEEGKSLTIVADFSSVDIEVLGNVGNKWFRQSQDNPLTLPLDNSMDDTILLSLVADLTDTTAGAPIMYAYLNDGSIQGWHAEHTKRYIGLLTPGTSSSVLSQSQEAKDTEMGSDSATPTMANAFSQRGSVFEQQPTTFGQTGFSQQGTSTFGQPSFGQPSLGQPSFGQPSFGQSNQTNNTTSPFGSFKPATGFGTFATRTSEFGSTSSFSGFGSSASTSHTFSQGNLANATPTKSKSDALSPNISPTITQEASMSDSTTGFGGLSLGTAASETKPVNSMFGSFGTPAITSNQTESSSPFGNGGVVKPASGFGAFGGLKTSGAFDSNGKPPSTVTAFVSPVSQIQPSSSGFGQTSFGQPAFGQTGFGSNSGKSAFGQPAFGKTSFGTTPTTTMAPASGGFAAFAKAPTNFTSPSTTTQPGFGAQESKPQALGGFSAFASATPAPLGSTTSSPGIMDKSTSKQPPGVGEQESKPEVLGGFAAFTSPAQTSFGLATSGPSVGGFNSAPKGFSPFALTSSTPDPGPKSEPSKPATPTRTSVFGTPLETTSGSPSSKDTVSTPKETPTRPITMSPPSSPEPKPASADVSPKPTVGGAFANIHTTPSSFQPAVGFGAFGSTTPKDSPFFKKPEPSSPFTPKFSAITSGSTTTTPAFGSTSVLGPSKPAFGSTTPKTPTPVKSTTTPSLGGGAFSAFSGSSSPLAVVAGQKKSFSDLLKTGGAENRDPEKPPLIPKKAEGESNGAKPQETRASVFGTQTRDSKKSGNVFLLTSQIFSTENQDQGAATSEDKGKGKLKASDTSESAGREESFTNVSLSSASSSFVEVDKDEGEFDQNSDQDDRSDFLTDEELSEEEGSDEESLPEEDEVKQSPTPSPTAVPLVSRSPSATPQPEVKIQVSDVSHLPIQEPPSREESTTPPGTPLKEVKSLTLNGPSTTSSLAIGLGRPSTRPVRRSPLANAVLLEGNETQEEAPLDSKKPEEAESPSINSRRKTPNIPTSTKGPGSLPTPPSATPPSPDLQSPSLDTFTKKPTVPVPFSPFSFGPRPVTTPPASSMFGHVADKSAPITMPPPIVRATTAPTTMSSQRQSLFGTQPPNTPASRFSMPSFTPPISAGTASTFPPLPKAPNGTPDPITSTTSATKQSQAVPSSSGLPLTQASKTQGKEIMEEGMQKECVNLVKTVEKEIEEVCFAKSSGSALINLINTSSLPKPL